MTDHSLQSKGLVYSLRPLKIEDAQFIIDIRTDPNRSKYIHSTSSSLADQEKFISGVLEEDNEWQFTVISNESGDPEGTICIYNFDEEKNCAEWGRWVLRPGSLAAVESAFLIYEVAFNQLELEYTYCHTESANTPVVHFHASMGLKETGEVSGSQGEQWTEQIMTSDMWVQLKPDIQKKVEMTARLANR